MKNSSKITVFVAFLSIILMAGQACAKKAELNVEPTAELEAAETSIDPVETEEVISEEKLVVADVSIPEKTDTAKEENRQEEKVAQSKKQEEPKEAEKEKKGKTIELEKFVPQTGLSFKFNRLLKEKFAKNLPPVEDGIHDPKNPASILLQTPKEGFSGYVKAGFGNRVDWVKTLSKEIINPRASLNDPTEEMDIMEINVVRIPVGSMPKVVFPHDRHTAWLGCENCHDEIFEPEAGANEISMELIIKGEKCGVCHGKVAFPISQCKKCHSLRKTKEEKAALGIK